MRRILYVCCTREGHDGETLEYSPFEDCLVTALCATVNRRSTRGTFDVLGHLERARAALNANRYDGIYFSNDYGSLITAVLAAEHGFPGPSLSAALRCYHKLYTRETLRHALRHAPVFLGDPEPPLPYPFYLKAPCSAFGLLGFTIRSRSEWEAVLPMVRRELPAMNADMRPLLERHADRTSFPLILEDVMLAEEIIDGHQVTVEGYVRGGACRFTVISDTNFFPGTRLIDGFTVPSRLPPDLQRRLFEQTEKDVLALELESTFFNAEYAVDAEGEIRLLEVNGRAAACFDALYKETLGFSVVEAGMRLAMGEEPRLALRTGSVGGQFNVITVRAARAGDIVDYSKVGSVPVPVTMTLAEHEQVTLLSEHGAVLGQMEITGSSHADIQQKADAYRRTLLR